jgi:hypothetical protein
MNLNLMSMGQLTPEQQQYLMLSNTTAFNPELMPNVINPLNIT